jgi:hypothetical protein
MRKVLLQTVGHWSARLGAAVGAALLLAAGLLMPQQAAAQSFSEEFGDISTLVGQGWYLQNNSSPVGSDATWLQGDGVLLTAYNGASTSYIAASINNAGSGGAISNWMLTPNRTFRNGDVLTFYTRNSGGTSDRMELRLSINGASTNVGSTAAGFGDFDTLLLSINPSMGGAYPFAWTLYTVTISGLSAPTSGRIGWRYFVTAPFQGSASTVGIDEVQYTPYVCPVLTLSPVTLGGGSFLQAYSQPLSQTGALGAPSYAVTAGALPPGLTLSASGTISGAATATGTFNFTATVSDASGCSVSWPYSINIAAALPSAPTIDSVGPGNGQATVSWTEPPYSGDDLIDYTVTAVQDNTKSCTANVPGTQCTVAGLTNGTAYSFTVVTRNGVGASPPATSGLVTPAGPPSVPQGVGASPGDTQARVAWQAPASNGGSAITGYSVVAVQDGSKGCTTTGALFCTVAGLANGSPYSFTVTASNGVGPGTASAASAIVFPTPADVDGPPPAPEPVVLAPGASGNLSAPTSATLGSGSTLTVLPSAAGGAIIPPAQGSATVHLGASGGSVSVAQSGGGRGVVLASASGAPVLGLGSGTTGSLQVASSQPNQVLLDVGPAGPGHVASGRQVLAGLQGARIQAQRAADGSLTVQVLEGSAIVPCGTPCAPNVPGNFTLLAGEQARFDAQGLAQKVTLQTAALPTPLPTGLQLAGTPGGAMVLDGPAPARTPGATLLAQAGAALRALLGAPLVSAGQQGLGNAVWTLPDGSTLGLLPLAPPYVSPGTPDGASLSPDGTLLIAHGGVVQTFGPAPLDLGAALQALQALVPSAQLSIGAAGTWRIEGPGGLSLSLRPAWFGSAGTAQGGAAAFFVQGPDGLPWLVQPNGLRTPLQPALADAAALRTQLQGADPQLQWQLGLDGTARVLLAGQPYLLQPQPGLAAVPGAASMWLEPSAGGQVLLRVRLADGKVQSLVVGAQP